MLVVSCHAVRGFPSIEHVCAGGGGGNVAFEGFVFYGGGDYALYPNIMLLVQVMAYVMSGTSTADIVRHWTCAPESGPLIGSPICTILLALRSQSSRRVS